MGGDGGSSSRGSGRGSGVTLLNSTDPFYKEFRDLPYYITSQRWVDASRKGGQLRVCVHGQQLVLLTRCIVTSSEGMPHA